MDKITIQLSKDEALVLCALLNQLENCGGLPASDSEEEDVLRDIIDQLENVLEEPFDVDYEILVGKAKARLQKIKNRCLCTTIH